MGNRDLGTEPADPFVELVRWLVDHNSGIHFANEHGRDVISATTPWFSNRDIKAAMLRCTGRQ